MSKEMKREAAGRSLRIQGRLPHKTGINMNMREKRTGTVLTLVAGCVIIAILAGVAAKFGVVDLYRRLSAAQSAYSQVHSQYETVQEQLTDYNKVLTEYRTYSTDWTAASPDANLPAVDRQAVLDLVETEMMSRGTVRSILIKGDTVSVTMSGMDLDGISEMFTAMKQYSIVDNVDLTMAETESDRPASILSFSLNITLSTEVEE